MSDIYDRDFLPAIDVDELREADRALTVANACLLAAEDNIKALRKMKFFRDEKSDTALMRLYYNLGGHIKTLEQLYKDVKSWKKRLGVTTEWDNE